MVKPTGIRVDSTSGVLFIADLHAFKAITVTKSLPPTPPTLNMDLANLLCQDVRDHTHTHTPLHTHTHTHGS